LNPRSLAIVIAAHNVGPFIHACLSSCAQAAGDLRTHLIVVNDASTDKTAAEIERFAAEFPDIDVVVRNTDRLGPALARNEGLQLNGFADYVCFVDGDDLICGNSLARTIAKMEAFRADFACPRVLAFDDAGRFQFEHDNAKLKRAVFGGRRNVITTARDTPQILDLETSMCMRIFRGSFFRDTGIRFPDLRMCEDVAPSRQALLTAKSILITDDIYYLYRLNRPGQRTSQTLESYFDMVEAIDSSLDEGLKHIVDNQQGAWLLQRLCRMALWGVELIDPDLLGSYAARIADVFERAPRGWWKTLLRLAGSSDRARQFAVLNGFQRSRLSREQIVFNRQYRMIDKLFLKCKGIR
jgi:glycosyltransferase involved in cell wall biosynthesis